MRRYLTICAVLIIFVSGLVSVEALAAKPDQVSNTITNLKQITRDKGVEVYPDPAPDEKFIVYAKWVVVNVSGFYDIFQLDLSNGREINLTPDSPKHDENPVYNEDGSKVLFDSYRQKERSVWIAEAGGGGGIQRISRGSSADFDGDISPDGQKVVFCAYKGKRDIREVKGGERHDIFRGAEMPSIMLANIDGSNQREIAKGINPTFSPDSKTIAFAGNISGTMEVYTLNIDGTGLTQITKGNRKEPSLEPTFSPCGEYLAFSSRRDKNWDIYMVEIKTNRLTQLTVHDEVDGGPSWGSEGNIYFHSKRSGSWDVWSMKPIGYDADMDKDNIRGAADKCPKQAEDFDNWQDEDGCPDPDNDGDGFLDADDKCPDQAEDMDGQLDEDGCPDLDNDNDGIPDDQDGAPTEPETLNGFRDDDGIPDRPPLDDKFIVAGLYFKSGRYEVTPESFAVLDDLSRKIEADTMAKVEVRAFTDSRGKDQRNLELSQRRADAVKAYLMSKGIDPNRLIAVGYGEQFPVADNRTAEGRAKNRRVEIVRLWSPPNK
ncbi:MAG: OmpA family protein [Candidatus Alcyoniella australis]|nr:OmpA family protein [Candidatus Alcyoniella australis]